MSWRTNIIHSLELPGARIEIRIIIFQNTIIIRLRNSIGSLSHFMLIFLAE